MTRKEKIIGFLKEDSYIPLKKDELMAVLCVPAKDLAEFEFILNELFEEGIISETKKHRIALTNNMGLVCGTFQGHEKGFGFVLRENDEDIFIPPSFTNGAMDNDRVVARITNTSSGRGKTEGEIIKITKRAHKTLVGTFEKSRNFGFVVPDDKRIPQDIFVSKTKFGGAENGDKVVVSITEYSGKNKNCEGEITEVLGSPAAPGCDISSIAHKYGVLRNFPEDVRLEADAIKNKISPKDIKNRVDLREDLIITIDGDDARDFDDAVSVIKNENGNYTLGVHIADVSHYVQQNSPLDNEAFERGLSVYLPDRVIPMLPEKLSNGICSLNPGEDRLAFTVIMEIDASGGVIKYDILKSVINSKFRFTYNNVTKMLEGDKKLIKKHEKFYPMLVLMKELSLILKNKRKARGSIDFDFPEAKIILNDKGKAIDIIKDENGISNSIIEEFMLLCNETVAEHVFWLGKPFVYRVHEEPSEEKLSAFKTFAHNLGYKFSYADKVFPKAFQGILEKSRGTKEERVMSTVMLRSLMKAMYDSENLGHFGLAAKHYCHFTSPIRRYPDLIIHRILTDIIENSLTEKKESFYESFVKIAATHSTDKEINATEAERECDDLKKTEFMAGKIGEDFSAIVSSVTGFGMFVELENTIEGLVRITSLEDDFYVLNEKTFSLVGERTKKTYKLGDTLNVRLIKADLAARQMEFIVIE